MQSDERRKIVAGSVESVEIEKHGPRQCDAVAPESPPGTQRPGPTVTVTASVTVAASVTDTATPHPATPISR